MTLVGYRILYKYPGKHKRSVMGWHRPTQLTALTDFKYCSISCG